MKTETLAYTHGGITFKGHLAYDEATAAKRPGIVLFHEGNGLGSLTKTRAERLAGLGYIALAADMYGNARAASTIEEAMALLGELRDKPDLIRARAGAALSALRQQPRCDTARLAAIGFCFGGTTCLELARSGADLCGIVSFHGVLETTAPARPGTIKAKVLVCAAEDDAFVPREQRLAFEDEMHAARADWQIILYGNTKHSFTNRDVDALGMPQFAYDKRADERSWAAMMAFFTEIFA